MGSIHGGQLDGRDDSPLLLAEAASWPSAWTWNTAVIAFNGGFQFEFGRDSLRVFSLFGEAGNGLSTRLTPSRQMWAMPAGLGCLGTGRPRAGGDRHVHRAAGHFGINGHDHIACPCGLVCFLPTATEPVCSWRLAAAAADAGGRINGTGHLVLYDLRAFDFVQLCFAFGMHFIVGWIYLFVSPLFLNRALPRRKKNPFGNK